MTAQEHIDKIGESVLEIERLANKTSRAALATAEAIKRHHVLLDEAQKAYRADHGNVVPFSGGTDKPPLP